MSAPTATSGVAFLRYAASGRNRFVTGIALLAALGGFLFGYDTGIIGQALPFIQRDFHPGTIASSWVVASLLIGAMIGAGVSGYLADRISRRWTKFASGCVYFAAALACAFAEGVTWLIAARFVLGLSVGTASFVAPEYIAEQTPPKIRGGTVTYNQVMITLGILVAYLIGFALKDVPGDWRWMLGLGAIPGAALAISMVFVPYSPRWLVSVGRVDEARDVLRRTRTGDIEAELTEIQDAAARESHWSLRNLLGRRVRPLLVIGIALAVLQQFVGINTVIYFASTILRYTGASLNQSIQLAVYVGVTNFVITIVAVLIMDWVGRRWLLLSGTALLTLSLFALGTYFLLPQLTHGVPWMGLVCVIAYIVGFAIGLGPVFWLMISEIYPLHFRSKAMAVATIANWAANFIVSYFFLQEVKAIGQPATFWIFGVISIGALIFFWLRVPETKNRSLEEIERAIGGEELAAAVTDDGAAAVTDDGPGRGR